MAITQTSGRRQEDSSTTGPEGLLPIEPNHPFVYFHADQGWQWDATGKRWIPYLNQIIGQRGCNGAPEDGVFNNQIATVQARGHTVIRPEDRRLGPYRNYLFSYPCVNRSGRKGKCWVSQFQEPMVRGLKVRWKVDTVGHYEFLDYLVTKGIIGPMGEDILGDKIEAALDRVERLAIHGANPVYAEKIKTAEQRVADMREAWVRQFGEEDEVEPKTKGKAKK